MNPSPPLTAIPSPVKIADELPAPRLPERTQGVMFSWSLLLAACILLFFAGLAAANVPLVLLALASATLLSLGVWLRRWRILAAISGTWLAASVIGVLLSPAIAIVLANWLTPRSPTGYQWSSPNSIFAAVVLTLLVLGTQLGASLTLYFWAQSHRTDLPRNLCPSCRYDLRATPSPRGALLDRCPECGWQR